MKLYQNLDVTLTYQNFGSSWLGILRGPTENIKLAFNGLFNLCATNGEIDFQDHLQLLATFWSNRKAMRRYFFNRFYLSRVTGERGQGALIRLAMRYALTQLLELNANSHEVFMNFETQYVADSYGSGTINAEKPDYSIQDSILLHALQRPEPTQSIVETT